MRHIYIERIVAVCPVADAPAVDIDHRIRHRSVEFEGESLACGVGDFYPGLVESLPHVGETAGSAGLPCGLGFAVLFHGDLLQVVVAGERAVDGPVMGNVHIFPGNGVFTEFPVLDGLRAAQGRAGSGSGDY